MRRCPRLVLEASRHAHIRNGLIHSTRVTDEYGRRPRDDGQTRRWLALLAGLGFGIPALLGTSHFARYGQVWQLWGYPTYGGGPFERLGLHTSIPLLVGFLIMCGVEVTVGILLLAGWEPALWLSLAMLPFELAYWIGFALPLGLVSGAARLIATTLAIQAR